MGSIYGIIAVGFSVTWTALNVLNFAQGQWVMLGAMVGLTFHGILGWHLIPSGILTLVALACFGAFLERLLVRPFLSGDSVGWVMTTLAFGIILENVAQMIWGTEPIPFPSPFGQNPISVLGAGVYPQEILIVAVSLVLMGSLELFYKFTLMGKALRATAFDRNVAAIMGINIKAMSILAFSVCSIFAAIAGVLIAPVTMAEATMGMILGLKAFAVAIIAGLTSAKGIFICGLIYGIAESLFAGYVYPGIREIFGFSLVILVLLVRPAGIFGIYFEKV